MSPQEEAPITEVSEPAEPSENGTLWESERIVSDALGRLMEFWGFKRHMGRVWAVLYLSDQPLTAADLRDRLALSSGAVSMTVSELSRWGVVRKVFVQGERRDYFEAEGNLWKMISRVLRERELGEISEAIEAFEDALANLKRKHDGSEHHQRATVQQARIEQLLELARLGRSMVSTVISSAMMDASWLPRFKLGGR
jgi:DNA-binding transcriptional regulator GbsR (MarR family)